MALKQHSVRAPVSISVHIDLTMNAGSHVETNASQIIHSNAGFQVIQKGKKIQFVQMVNPQLQLKGGPLLSKV